MATTESANDDDAQTTTDADVTAKVNAVAEAVSELQDEIDAEELDEKELGALQQNLKTVEDAAEDARKDEVEDELDNRIEVGNGLDMGEETLTRVQGHNKYLEVPDIDAVQAVMNRQETTSFGAISPVEVAKLAVEAEDQWDMATKLAEEGYVPEELATVKANEVADAADELEIGKWDLLGKATYTYYR